MAWLGLMLGNYSIKLKAGLKTPTASSDSFSYPPYVENRNGKYSKC